MILAAQKAGQLSEKETEVLLDNLKFENPCYESVVSTAVNDYPNSCEFWYRLLHYYTSKFDNNMDTLIINFKSAIDRLALSPVEDLFRIFKIVSIVSRVGLKSD